MGSCSRAIQSEAKLEASEFVLLGVLSELSLLDWSNLDTFATTCPVATLTLPLHIPELRMQWSVIEKICSKIEHSIPPPSGNCVVTLTSVGNPIVRLPTVLKVRVYLTLLYISLTSSKNGARHNKHTFSTSAFVQYMDAFKRLDSAQRDMVPPANESNVATYGDGCWVTRPLPIYSVSGRLLSPARYATDLLGSVVAVHATVVHTSYPGTGVSSLHFDAQSVRIIQRART